MTEVEDRELDWVLNKNWDGNDEGQIHTACDGIQHLGYRPLSEQIKDCEGHTEAA